MLLDIVILPPAKLRNKIGKAITRAVRGYPVKYFIDNKKLIPHMSLFHIRTSESRLAELSKKIRSVVRTHRAQRIKNVGFTAYKGIVGNILLTNNQALRRLNKEIVKNCYELRTGEMPWTSKTPPKGIELLNRKKYGTQHNIGKTFVPHFTIFRTHDEETAQGILGKMKKFQFSFLGDTIAICQVNIDHQVTKVLKTFKLKQ